MSEMADLRRVDQLTSLLLRYMTPSPWRRTKHSFTALERFWGEGESGRGRGWERGRGREGGHLIHGEEGSGPVKRAAGLPQLMVDPVSLPVERERAHFTREEGREDSLLLPLPHLLNELVSPDIVSGDPSLSHQLLLHYHLSGYTCVVAPRHPHDRPPLHPVPDDYIIQSRDPADEPDWSHCSPSDDGVLDGIGEGVAEMERARHVGRREGDDEETFWIGLTHTLPLPTESKTGGR